MREIKTEGDILNALVDIIDENAQFLSEIDGAIGDGDHGINMRKGFNFFRDRNNLDELSLSSGFQTLGDILLNEIGGSMGPLYGLFFTTAGESLEKDGNLKPQSIYNAILNGYDEIISIGGAKVGDKTLIDALHPSLEALKKAIDESKSDAECFSILADAAENGKESTKDMVAKIGRASRLGERSAGVYDPGATSCSLIIQTIANGLKELKSE